MTTSVRDRAVKLLGQNIPQHLVAAAVGVSEAYIAQLLQEPEVADDVARAKAASLEKVIEQKETIDDIATQALKVVRSRLSFAKSPLEAARVFQILDNARNKGAPPSADTGGKDVVTITLPAAARASINIQLNSQNQVIDVEGRSMAPLPSKALPNLLKEKKQVAEVTPKLPHTEIDKTAAASKLTTLADISTVMNGVKLVL